jgi:hypothetical protein
MESAPDYMLAFLIVSLGGCVSFAIVVGAAVGLQRTFGIHREGVIGLLTVYGFLASVIGQRYQIRWLGLGVIFYCWIALLIELCVFLLVWRAVRYIWLGAKRLTSRST